MLDRREQILRRLLVILSDVPGDLGYLESSAWRNRGELKGDKRPAVVLLDGSEVRKSNNEGKGRVFMSPSVMSMSPQIFVLLKLRERPTNEEVGEELNLFRVAVIKAIAGDRELARLCGSNGQVSLRRVVTSLQTGSSLEGQMQLDFIFDYVLNPNDVEALPISMS